MLFCIVFIGINNRVKAQEIPCDVPEGFQCGATEGNVYDVTWVTIPGYIVPVPVITSKKCCVESVQTNACNAVALDCTEVEIK